MDKSCPDTGVSMATQKAVGVAMAHRAHSVLFDLVIAGAMTMEGRRVMEDVCHSTQEILQSKPPSHFITYPNKLSGNIYFALLSMYLPDVVHSHEVDHNSTP